VLAPHLLAISRMHFGAAVRDVLTASCGSDLRHAKAHDVLPDLQSPQTLRLLAANLELAFGVTVPSEELAHLTTVRDVLQCVRLHRWVKRVEADAPAPPAEAAADVTSAADASAPAIAAEPPTDPRQGHFRFTRRSVEPSSAPLLDRHGRRPQA
jgi:hypothetical protein